MKKLYDIIKIEKESVIDPPQENLNPEFFKNLSLHRKILKSFKKLISNLVNEIPLKNFQGSIEQMIFVGSLAGYQWNYDSDIDLHIVIDSEELANKHNLTTIELVQTLREIAKKFNKRFYVIGYPVEFYIQEKNEPFYSNGIYDINYDTWVKEPTVNEYNKERVQEAKELAKQYKSNIILKLDEIDEDLKIFNKNGDNIQKLIKDKEYLQSELKVLSDKRNTGIRQEGDTAINNMFFKFLGRMKILKKMKEKIEEIESIEFS